MPYCMVSGPVLGLPPMSICQHVAEPLGLQVLSHSGWPLSLPATPVLLKGPGYENAIQRELKTQVLTFGSSKTEPPFSLHYCWVVGKGLSTQRQDAAPLS